MPARLRFCSTGSSLPSIVIPGSSSRTASMSTGSSASSPAGAERCSRAPLARSTRCSRSSPAAVQSARTLGDAERTLVLRHLIASAPPGSLGPSARFAGFADSLAGALDRDRGQPARSRGSRPRPGRADARLPSRARAPCRPRSRHGSPAGRRAADERARVVERCSGLRVRLRGPDGSGVAPDRGARGAR